MAELLPSPPERRPTGARGRDLAGDDLRLAAPGFGSGAAAASDGRGALGAAPAPPARAAAESTALDVVPLRQSVTAGPGPGTEHAAALDAAGIWTVPAPVAAPGSAARPGGIRLERPLVIPPLRSEDARQGRDWVAWRQLGSRLRWRARAALALARDATVVATVTASVGSALGAVAPVSLVTIVTVLALAVSGRYRITARSGSARSLAAALALGFAAIAVNTGWSGARDAAALAVTIAGAGVALAVAQRLTTGLLDPRRSPRARLTAAAIVGNEGDAAAAYLALGEAFPDRLREAFPLSDPRRERPHGRPASRLKARLAAGDVREVVLVSRTSARGVRALAATCWRGGARCFVAFDAAAGHAGRGVPVRLGTVPAWELLPGGAAVPSLAAKRALDLALTCMALVVAIPLMAAIALAIRLDSPGPVFFRQRRVGLGGRAFTIWKFRSMRVDERPCPRELARLNPYGDAPLFKLRDDPRTTRVGRLLRRTSLDELPQLINVLRGEMSLVGPRPPLPEEVARYDAHHFVRLSVLPGMTGPWQVGGRNLITDFEQIVRMERAYIERWALATDVRIIVRTFGVVVRGTGAY